VATPRAGIVVTGTEVLTGRVLDRNGGWISERLRELGIEHEHTVVVGDRPQDMRDALDFLAARGVDVIVTSGGLGPTADDLTAEVVAEYQQREMVLDEPTEARIAEILKPLLERFPNLDMEAVREANRKQAVVPQGSTILSPVGTAPGLVVPPADGAGPTIVVLPGPPRELQPMWPRALETDAVRAVLDAAVTFAERVRKAVEAHTFTFDGGTLQRTMSCGVAAWPHPRIEDCDALVKAADDALYVAKETGRNRVIRFDSQAFNEHTQAPPDDSHAEVDVSDRTLFPTGSGDRPAGGEDRGAATRA